MWKEIKLPDWVVKYQNFIKALVMMFLPLLCCVITCALDGKSLSDVYMPASEWNDELFYYKQVESILQYGFPQGYFGFNESQALKLSFAAWSPVLIFPWLLWGLLFGWNEMSPVYCNIFVMMIAVFLFVYLVRPKLKQCLMLAVLYFTFTPMTRYILSYMPEALCFAMVIVLTSLAISYVREERNWKLAVLTVMASVMTLMRPYLLLFMIFPIWFWYKKNRVWGSVLMAAVLGVTGVCYWAINHYLAAAYFNPLFDTTFITVFFTDGIWAGIKYTPYKLWDAGKTVLGMMVEGFKTGYYTGTQFSGFCILMVLFGIQAFSDYRKKKWQELQIHLPLTICFLGILLAVLLMYKPLQGGRHLLTFVVLGIFVLSIMETRFYRRTILTAGIFAYLYMVMIAGKAEQQIPYRDGQREETLAMWEKKMSEKMVLETEDVPGFDNVIIWTLSDEVDGEVEMMNWQELYAVPAGFGISCCQGDFVAENLESLKSRYLAVPVGGKLDEACAEASYEELGRSEKVAVYRLH